jgi:hypothetical protein
LDVRIVHHVASDHRGLASASGRSNALVDAVANGGAPWLGVAGDGAVVENHLHILDSLFIACARLVRVFSRSVDLESACRRRACPCRRMSHPASRGRAIGAACARGCSVSAICREVCGASCAPTLAWSSCRSEAASTTIDFEPSPRSAQRRDDSITRLIDEHVRRTQTTAEVEARRCDALGWMGVVAMKEWPSDVHGAGAAGESAHRQTERCERRRRSEGRRG